jgi:hypothetical protein
MIRFFARRARRRDPMFRGSRMSWMARAAAFGN